MLTITCTDEQPHLPTVKIVNSCFYYIFIQILLLGDNINKQIFQTQENFIQKQIKIYMAAAFKHIKPSQPHISPNTPAYLEDSYALLAVSPFPSKSNFFLHQSINDTGVFEEHISPAVTFMDRGLTNLFLYNIFLLSEADIKIYCKQGLHIKQNAPLLWREA